MAKRRTSTPKVKAEDMVKDPEATIENALGQTEAWFEKNWKTVVTALVAVLVVVAGVYAYEGLYKIPRGKKAADAMWVAEQLFIAGEYATALNGDGTNLGFADIVSSFGGTREARLAAHYAGICQLKQGELDGALEYLGKYRAVRGVTGAVVNAENEGLKGDVYVQRGDYAAAAGHFRKAADANANILTTPMYLKKLGLALEATGDYKGAVAAYKRVSDEYPTSLEARDIAKFSAAAEQKL